MIDWFGFARVFLASLVAASVLVTLFALGLRLGDSALLWRKAASVVLFVLCGVAVIIGIYLIVPALH